LFIVRKITLTIKDVIFSGFFAILNTIPMFLAFAKINIGLYVVERRPDGFHNIETVFHRIAVADTLRIEPAAEIRVTSSSPDAPSDQTNICFKAAALLQKDLGVTAGAHIHIDKDVPVGAGLGGGSADAACVLRQLPALWGAAVPEDTLRIMALALGSDVPYFLSQGSAVAAGRGEQLRYFALDVPYAILLCNPGIHVATGWAYGQIKPGRKNTPADLAAVVREGMREPSILRESLRNDFETVVLAAHPVVADVKDTMVRSGAVFAMMSGSGSTVYGLFSDVPAAEHCAVPLAAAGYRTFITPPHFTGA
jgi:4-diphosphocytidyl-2-C-methyl-D-erythritol kinase